MKRRSRQYFWLCCALFLAPSVRSTASSTFSTLSQDSSNNAGRVVRTKKVTIESVRSATLLPSQAITTVHMAELQRTRGQTLGESLQNVAGITLLQTGASIAKPVVRGLHSQRIVIVNAGVVQEGQQWGAEHAPEIDPFTAQRIEILRGAAGVEYGAGALGGVIRVVPHDLPHDLPDNKTIGGELILSGFSNNSQGAVSLALQGSGLRGSLESVLRLLAVDSTAAVAIENGFGWRVQASSRRAGDSRAPSYTISNTGFQEINASVAFGYTGQKFSIEAYYSLFSTELGIFSGSHIGNLNDLRRAIERGRPMTDALSWTYTIRTPRQEISHHLWSVKARHEATFGQFEAQYGWQFNDRAEFDAHSARVMNDSAQLAQLLARPATNLQLQTYSLDVKFRHKPFVVFTDAVLSGVAGVNATTQRNVQSGRAFLIPSFEAFTGGVYATETLTMPQITLNAGVRADRREVSVVASTLRGIPDTTQVFHGFSGAVGAIWYAGEAPAGGVQPWSLSANLGSAWRAPLVNEQFSNGVHHGTAQYEIGNPFLVPERSYTADLTLQYHAEWLHCEVSAYYNLINNFVYLRPDPQNPTISVRGSFPTFFYTQTLARLYGMDGSVDAVLATFTNENVLRAGGTISIVRGDNVSQQEPLLFMPADRVRLFGRLEAQNVVGMPTVYIEAATVLVRTQDRVPPNADYASPPSGYALLNVSVGGQITLFGTQLSWNTSVSNVFNTAYRDYLSRYRYFTDDAGRNVALRLSVPFGSHAQP
jgi:iron complex outermembrane recepter protein